MSALHQLRQGLNEVWGSVREGWQRLYQRAAGAKAKYKRGVLQVKLPKRAESRRRRIAVHTG